MATGRRHDYLVSVRSAPGEWSTGGSIAGGVSAGVTGFVGAMSRARPMAVLLVLTSDCNRDNIR